MRARHLVLTVTWTVFSTSIAFGANTIDLTGNVKWTCEGDVRVSLDQKNGNLRITSASAGIDQTLSFHSCHSSHCDWGPKETAALCEQAPCAEVLADRKDQSLSIWLVGFESRCVAEKSKELQD